MGPGLVSSCGGWRTGCPQSAPLLPGPWGWNPWTEPETLTAASQLGGPEGPLELEFWEGLPFAWHWQGSGPKTQTEELGTGEWPPSTEA